MKLEKGFTLIEIIVSVGILAILCVSAYGLYTAIYNGIASYRKQATISALANKYLEIARNLPYSQVGTINGNPHGNLPDEPNALTVTFNGSDYQIYYVVNALHDPADPNLTIQNYKQIKLYVKDVSTDTTKSFVTTIAPINLASMADGGALSIQVIGSIFSAWQPIAGATITIKNTDITPNINLTRTTDSNGKWNEVGLPPDSNYQITITKNGYSLDRTYSTTDYPGTTQPNATVLDKQTQNITMVIDKLSNLTFYTKNETCQPISDIAVNVKGSKLISPSVLKFDEDFTSNSGGSIYPTNTSSCSTTCGAASCCLEWDTYTPTVTSSQYMIYGTSPIQSANLLPDTNKIFNLILGPKTAYSELVVVKDTSAEGDLIENAKVELTNASLGYDEIKYTGGSVWSQRDWSGGSGQDSFLDTTRYYQDDGHISNSESPLALRLAKNPSDNNYFSSGYLISSTFDTGTNETSYTFLDWKATQDPEFSVGFQIATSDEPHNEPEDTYWDTSTNYKGEDGTSNTFYSTPTAINSAHNNKRYARYKVFLATTNPLKTPQVSSVSLNYISGCPTPGQVMFPGLQADNNYTATITADGYEPLDPITPIKIDSECENGYCVLQVFLTK